MLSALRDGRFITAERIRVYCLMLLAAYVVGTVVWFGTADGLLDWQDRPLGTDFAQVHVAGQEVLQGQPAMPFDNAAHIARQQAVFGPRTAVFTWGYPPYFLGIAALLALLPYLPAFFAWQGTTFALYVLVLRQWLPRREALLPILAFPAVYVNFGHGQTGFAATALLGGALLLLRRHPWLAGLPIGLLAFKPQLGLLIPVALIAAGHWRTIVSATGTLVAMTVLTWAAFGPDTVAAFLDSLPYSRIHGLEYSNTGFHKMQSLFAAVRLIDGPIPLAYALQGSLMAAVAIAVAIVWRRPTDFRLKSATLMTGALLATPYVFDYDLVLLAPAIAALASLGLEHGFRPGEKTFLATVWTMPLIARTVAQVSFVPLGFLCVLLLFVMAVGRAIRMSSAAPSTASAKLERCSDSGSASAHG